MMKQEMSTRKHYKWEEKANILCLEKEFYASVLGKWRVSVIRHQLSSTSTGISAMVGHLTISLPFFIFS
jgi:hypothetical protein